jgi:hypothetical protein
VSNTHSTKPGNSDILSDANGPQNATEEPPPTAGRPSNTIPNASTAGSFDFPHRSLPKQALPRAPRAEPPALPRIEIPLQRQEVAPSQSPVVAAQSARPSPTVIMDASGNQLRRQLQASEVNYEASMPSSMPLPSSMIEQQSYPSPLSVSTLAQPSKRQRTQASIMPSMQSRIPMIDGQIQNLRKEPGYNDNMLEIPRYNLLKDACVHEDVFYVALHQIFCIWDLPDPTQIAAIPEFPSSTVLLQSFPVIATLLRENDSLRQAHKLWFAQFPSPLAILLKSSGPYQRMVRGVGKFLGKLHIEWKRMTVECSARQYPPLVDELVGRMGLLSPTLQHIMFTAIRRNLGILDGHWGQRMEVLFKRDRKEHQALSERYNTARPPTQKEVNERNTILVNEYLVLCKSFLQLRNQGSANPSSPVTRLPTPVVSSNGTIVAGAHPNIIQRNNSSVQKATASRRASLMTAQQAGNIRIPAISSPGMCSPTTAGLMGSNVVQQPYQTVQSSANFQGLSAQSPVHAYPHSNMQYLPGVNNSLYPSQIHNPQHPNVVQQLNPALLGQQTIQQHLWPQQNSHQPYFQQHTQANQHLQQQHALMGQFSHAQTTEIYGQQTPNPHARRTSASINDYHPTTNMRAASNATTLRTSSTSINDTPRWQAGLNTEQLAPNGTSIPSTANQIRAMHRSVRVQQMSSIGRPLLLDRNSAVRPLIVDPDKTAMHQAHLRSPKLVVPSVPRMDNPQVDPEWRYYQVVKSLAFGPSQLRSDGPLTKFNFTLSGDELSRIPEDDLSSNAGRMGTRPLHPGAIQYRVRCIQTNPEVANCSIHDWIVRDTSWPESCFIAINRQPLEIRRKFHHGKDLPIDITPKLNSLRPQTLYEITVSIPKWRELKLAAYFFAVEVIEILHHKQILDIVQRQRVPAVDTLESIKRVLAPPAADDEDFAMVVGDLTVDLADPFTAKIFEVPVRSKHCLHRECFDLATFLQTRNSKPKRPQQPCMPDVWKCPLCAEDSRPSELQIDDFLVAVREELARTDDIDVKAIIIAPNGTWKPKREPRSKRKATRDPYDDGSSDEEPGATLGTTFAASVTPGPRVIEIIDLDDD